MANKTFLILICFFKLFPNLFFQMSSNCFCVCFSVLLHHRFLMRLVVCSAVGKLLCHHVRWLLGWSASHCSGHPGKSVCCLDIWHQKVSLTTRCCWKLCIKLQKCIQGKDPYCNLLFFVRFMQDLEDMLGFRPYIIYFYLWKYVSPFCLIVLISATVIEMAISPPGYNAWVQELVSLSVCVFVLFWCKRSFQMLHSGKRS